MKRLYLLVILFLFIPVFFAPAQEYAEDSNEDPAVEIYGEESITGEITEADAGGETETADGKEAEDDYLEMDIRTSTLMELAAWCRELGLPEGGAKEELASRLRNYYQLPPSMGTSTEGQRIITIESARITEYFSIDVVDEEYARLKGDVIISLKDGNSVHRIKAWEILYNRTRNVITATGNVEYVKEDGDTIETFRGESISVNLDNWSSIFLDGVSEKSISGNATAYRFAGTVISRNSEEVTVLTGADITNPSNDEAFWSLHASKLWLLPGNDWAILNAVLKVGNIPLLYLPFFYYPADEIVFHPVLGSRTREGTFLQTTTYILGRPKTSLLTENSLTKIFGSASEGQVQKREGVFLRNTGEKAVNPGDTRLSVIFDAYVNLGLYLGTEFFLPRKGIFGDLNISAGLGRTRNIYQVGNANTPFPKYDGTSEWNSIKLFSLDFPLRYRLDLTWSLTIPRGSLSLALPFYSDPYVDRDFMQRSEVLDWLSMLREGASASAEETFDDTYLNSYEWKIYGSFNMNVTGLSPYVSSLSISSISSSLLFSSKDSVSYSGPYSPPNPGRLFFNPSRFTIYSISASVAGTPLTFGKTAEPLIKAVDATAPGDSLLPAPPISPWETPDSVQAGPLQEKFSPKDQYSFSPPVLAQKFDFSRTGGPSFSIDYRFTPTTASEMQFNSDGWKEQDEIDWGDVESILSKFRGDGNIGFNLSHTGGGAYSASLRFSGTGSWQDYWLLNEDADKYLTGGVTDQNKVQSDRNRAYNETYVTSSWDLSTTVRPFYQSSVWGNTSLSYNLRGLLAKTTVDTTGADPEWDWVFGLKDKENINTNQITASVAANIMDYNQSLSLTAVLPPIDSSVSANATIRAFITETSARGSIQFPFESDKRKIDPVYLTETLRFKDWGSFQFYTVYDPEKNEDAFKDNFNTVTASFNLSKIGLTASYSATYAQRYRYNYNSTVDPSRPPNTWILTGDNGLYSREFRMGYIKKFSKNDIFGKPFSFSVDINTGFNLDLQRYTSSKLNFGLGLTVGISKFLDLSLSTSSENAVLFKYLQKLPFYDMPTELYQGQETNFFVDLFNSFRFDDNDLRRQSGFKLKSLNLSLKHYLGDWNAELSIYMTPSLDRTTVPYTYKFQNEISFLIQWLPIGEIKANIEYKDEKLTVK